MAKLTYLEKKLLEELLGMGGGYVLDFSDITYAAFFRDLGVDIEHQRYHINGRSKAKRMRAFWELGSDADVGRALQALFDYIEATDPDGAGCPVDDKHKKIANRLLGKKGETEAPATEDEFLAAEFGKLNLEPLKLDAAMEDVVTHRFTEIKTSLSHGAPLAAILLSGSTLEALLLNAAIRNPQMFNEANAAPKSPDKAVKKFHEWNLNELINVSYELKMIGLDVKKFSHALRDFRNYIHPFEQAQSSFRPDEHTARISWQVLRAAIASLSGKR